MAGPSWLIRQGVKSFLKDSGADPGLAKAGGYAASTISSLVFHDHHTHFVPDADEVVDAIDSISDSADIDVTDSFDNVAETSDYAQSSAHEAIAVPQQHFGSYDYSDSSSTDDSYSSYNSYLTSSSTIDPNGTYEVNGQTVYGSDLKEGANGYVYSNSSYGESSNSDAISKSDIKRVS